MGLLHSKALTRLWMRRAGSLWHIFGKSAHALSPIFGKSARALSPIFGKSARALSPIFGKSARALSKKVRGQDALELSVGLWAAMKEFNCYQFCERLPSRKRN